MSLKKLLLDSIKIILISYLVMVAFWPHTHDNIFILPSFTEGHPMALLEALARRRPVIVFDEIKHVIGDKKGIFVSKRNYESLLDVINNIKNNYQKIQEEMKQNNLPTNKEFIKQMRNIISNLN